MDTRWAFKGKWGVGSDGSNGVDGLCGSCEYYQEKLCGISSGGDKDFTSALRRTKHGQHSAVTVPPSILSGV